MKNKLTFAIVGILVLAVVGGYFYPKVNTNLKGTSSAGVSNSSAKVASITIAPLTASATTSSITNTDGTDREITDGFVTCQSVGSSRTYLTGAGLTSGGWGLVMSTSSSAVDAKVNANYAINFSSISTTTTRVYSATSTEGVLTYVSRIWPNGTKLNMTFNATNTAACTIGVHYLSL